MSEKYLDLIRQLDMAAYRPLPNGDIECVNQIAVMAKEAIIELDQRLLQEERLKYQANKRADKLLTVLTGVNEWITGTDYQYAPIFDTVREVIRTNQSFIPAHY